jgi:hypothetical protein
MTGCARRFSLIVPEFSAEEGFDKGSTTPGRFSLGSCVVWDQVEIRRGCTQRVPAVPALLPEWYATGDVPYEIP